MLKLLLTFALCVFIARAKAGPIEDAVSEGQIQLKMDGKIVDHHKPVNEIVHVHHVPAQISLVVHEPHYEQLQHQQDHQISQVPIGKYLFYLQKHKSDSMCTAPTGAGFRRLFREAHDLLPKKAIAEIVRNANKYDPEVRAFRKIIFSQQTLNKLLTLRTSTQFVHISDYACKHLFMNIDRWLKVVSCVIASKEPEIANESKDYEEDVVGFKGRPGLRGMLKDIYDILPREQLKLLYLNLKESDPFLATGVMEMKSPAFRLLLQNLRDVPEYKNLKSIVINAGLPIEDYNQLMAAYLGWQGDVPEEILNV